ATRTSSPPRWPTTRSRAPAARPPRPGRRRRSSRRSWPKPAPRSRRRWPRPPRPPGPRRPRLSSRCRTTEAGDGRADDELRVGGPARGDQGRSPRRGRGGAGLGRRGTLARGVRGFRAGAGPRKRAMDVTTMNYASAAADALARSMRADPAVVALGEDLGRGGIFGQYRGLVEEFGPQRIIDTPISEDTIVGAAVGMALTGLR